jgi:riboflavin kinase
LSAITWLSQSLNNLDREHDNNAMRDERSKPIEIRGVACTGTGTAMLFTELPWVKRQLAQKLGMIAWPGTFNLTVLPEDRNKLKTLEDTDGIEMLCEDASHCNGKAFRATINGQIEGAIIIPLVPAYPEGQLEIVSAEHVRKSLGLKDGDPVNIIAFI